MSPAPPVPLTLADVILAVQNHPDISDDRRRDLRSAVRRIAELLNTPPEQLRASLQAFRGPLAKIVPAAHGFGTKTWQNLRSNFLAAIHLAVPRGGRRHSPTPDWKPLHERLPGKRMQNGLSRFLTFCDRMGIAPDQVTNAVADQFAATLVSDTLVARPQAVHQRTCRLWNEATAIPGWPQVRLIVPDHRKRATVPVTDLPRSFREELDRHLEWLAGRDLFADRPPPTACKPRSVALRRTLILLAVAALVAGGRPPEQISQLSDLVTPASVKAILRHYIAKKDGTISFFTRSLATTLIALAQHWVRVTPEHLAELQNLRKRLGKTPSGLTTKNRGTLRELSDPVVRQRLFDLPQQLVNEATSGRLSPGRAAIRFQLGLAIEILLMAPLRMNNLAALRLDRHLVRPGGRHALWRIVVAEHEVKNREPLEYELPPEATRLLDLYLRQFRPYLGAADSPFLFTARGGGPKSQATLSLQLTDLIWKRVGVRMTPHQFRHFAARLMLAHSPGAFAATGHLLGHRNLQTTTKFYAGLDTLTAGRHFDRILAAERAPTPAARKRTGQAPGQSPGR
jgi:integrase